jgi:LPXTG-motif cell wall-anchored protein
MIQHRAIWTDFRLMTEVEKFRIRYRVFHSDWPIPFRNREQPEWLLTRCCIAATSLQVVIPVPSDGQRCARHWRHNALITHTAQRANQIDVLNQQGTELPSTGGIGTTIFYILGGLLVVGAAVILVARRKAQD